MEFDLERGLRVIESEIRRLYTGENVIFVGIAGGSCSGKGYLIELLKERTNVPILSMDDYYKGRDFMEDDNYDKPESLELNLFRNHLSELKRWNEIIKPIYDFKSRMRIGYEKFYPVDALLIEGLYCFYGELKELFDIKVFIDAEEEIRLKRRLERDTERTGDSKEKILQEWDNKVQKYYLSHVKKQKKYADIIIKNE